jgi:hypothetical protein
MQRIPPIFIGLAVSGALALLGWVLYGFAFSYVRSESAKLTLLEEDVAHAAQKEHVLKSVKAIVADTAPERATLEGFFVEKEGIVPFLELVERVGEHAGVKTEVTSVSLEQHKTKDALVEDLRISVKGDGSFSGVFAFLVMVENLPFGVRVQNTNITKRTEPNTSGWRIVLTFTVPKLK